MFQSILSFLNQPYPAKDDLRSVLKESIYSAVIVWLVLVLFKPGNFDNDQLSIFLHAGLFALVTFLVVALYNLICIYVFKINRDTPKFTFWKWFLLVIILVLCIALGNFALIVYMENSPLSLHVFWIIIYQTFVVAIIPVFTFGALNLIRNLKANQVLAKEINHDFIHPYLDNEQRRFVEIPIKNSSKSFKVNPNDILYLEAMQNYVSIYYLLDGKPAKEIIRNTLSAIAISISSKNIKRSHRSFLVNTEKIENIEGNAQGLKLKLKELKDAEIPVSRKYISLFR